MGPVIVIAIWAGLILIWGWFRRNPRIEPPSDTDYDIYS